MWHQVFVLDFLSVCSANSPETAAMLRVLTSIQKTNPIFVNNLLIPFNFRLTQSRSSPQVFVLDFLSVCSANSPETAAMLRVLTSIQKTDPIFVNNLLVPFNFRLAQSRSSPQVFVLDFLSVCSANSPETAAMLRAALLRVLTSASVTKLGFALRGDFEQMERVRGLHGVTKGARIHACSWMYIYIYKYR